MNKYYKAIILTILFLLSVTGCSALYGTVYRDATMILGYGDKNHVIKDSSKVSVLAFPSHYGLYINDIEVKNFNDKVNTKNFPVAKNVDDSSIYTIELLPGTYKIGVTINETRWNNTGSTQTVKTISTNKPIEETINFKGGQGYYIELHTQGSYGRLAVQELPESILNIIDENRQKAQY